MDHFASGNDPVAIASILAAIVPGLAGAVLLLFRVQDPFGRTHALVWALPALGPFVAVFLGHRARRRARAAGGTTGLATVGLVLGYLGLAVYLAIAVLGLIVYALVGPWGHP